MLNLVPEGKQVWELVCLGPPPLQRFIVFLMEGEAEGGKIISTTFMGIWFRDKNKPPKAAAVIHSSVYDR